MLIKAGYDIRFDTDTPTAMMANLSVHPSRHQDLVTPHRITTDPEVLAARYAAVVHRLIRGLAARGPVILVCEDIHWADQASIDMLLRLLPLAVQHRHRQPFGVRGEPGLPERARRQRNGCLHAGTIDERQCPSAP